MKIKSLCLFFVVVLAAGPALPVTSSRAAPGSPHVLAPSNVTFVYHDLEDAAHAGEAVYLAGSWDGWSSLQAMTADAGSTTFTVTLSLADGNTYEYKYIVNDGANDRWDWLNTDNRSVTVTADVTLHDYRNVAVGWANLQWPPAITIVRGQSSGDIYGQLLVNGVTNLPGEGRSLRAELGYGTDADYANQWTWVSMAFNTDVGNNDEFKASLAPTATGVYSYAARYDGNWGVGNPNRLWTYGDLDGTNNGFSLAQAGVLTVNGPPVINEIDYDQAGTDAAEFVEIKNTGDVPVNLDLYVLRLVNGAGGGAAPYSNIDLPNVELAAGGYYVVCGNAANVANCDLDVTPDENLIQNGAPDAVALLLGADIIDTVSYEGNTGAPYTEGAGVGLEDAPGTPTIPILGSIARYPDGADTNQNNVDLSLRCITPGAANGACTPSDLQIIKTVQPAWVSPGAAVTFTLVFTNNGPAPAGGVVITDLVPAQVTGLAVSNSGVTLTLRGGTAFVWDAAIIPVGAGGVITITGVVAGIAASGPLINTAEIAGVVLDHIPGNNSSQASAEIIGGLLLIPDGTNDRVMAFNPVSGDLIDANFIPPDPDHLSTPVNAILSADSAYILVSDQLDDVVQAYDLQGNYVGVFAPSGGVSNTIADNIRGVALQPNGNLLVSVAGGANANAVAEFDTAGNYVGNFIANGSGGLNSPWDVYRRAGDWLVSASGSDKILRYDLAGNYVGDFYSPLSFPQQIAQAGNGNVLVANYSGLADAGIWEFTSDGVLVAYYNLPTLASFRGVYELPSGNLLVATGNGVFEVDRANTVVSTKISGVSCHFIEYVPPIPDVFIVKTVTPASALPGQAITYTLSFANGGTQTAAGVIITDHLPISVTVTGVYNAGAVITDTGATPPYVWQVANLLPGAGGVITITGVLSSSLLHGDVLINTAVISALAPESNPGNNASSVSVTVLNIPPVANDDAYAADEDTPLSIAAPGILDNDTDAEGDPLSAVLDSGPTHGALALAPDGSFAYTPTTDYAGADSFTYYASDGMDNSNVATVTLTVNPINDPPTANGDAYTTPQDTPLVVPAPGILGNDTDVDGDLLSAALSGTVSHGTLALGLTGVFTYTPDPGYVGVDTFTYRADDGADYSNLATVTLTVTAASQYAVDVPLYTASVYAIAVAPIVITNTGGASETYALALSGNTWNAFLSEAWVTLNPGDDVVVELTVEFPPAAGPYVTDTLDLSITPQAGAPFSATLTVDTACRFDLDGNNIVDIVDMVVMLDQVGGSDPYYDVNHDGAVDVTDVVVVLGRFGASCP